MTSTDTLSKSPIFLRMAGHPIRWRLLTELGRSDRKVRELTEVLGEPQSLVSYHLGQLRAGGLVSMRRSAADSRDAYYRVDLVRCGELLEGVGAALHPALAPSMPAGGRGTPSGSARASVLFVCTGNSSRSQLAEAFLRQRAPHLDVASAGSHPKPLHRYTIRVAEAYGIDLHDAQPTHIDDVRHRSFNYVVTLCDRMREVCPEFEGAPALVHWSVPDPADATVGPVTYARFRDAAADIYTRVEFLLSTITADAMKGGNHAR